MCHIKSRAAHTLHRVSFWQQHSRTVCSQGKSRTERPTAQRGKKGACIGMCASCRQIPILPCLWRYALDIAPGFFLLNREISSLNAFNFMLAQCLGPGVQGFERARVSRIQGPKGPRFSSSNFRRRFLMFSFFRLEPAVHGVTPLA